ncbi:MAG: haloalkane dehalogenase [Candidatus Aldehydirespiratoraceae bacterium]
MPAITEAHQHRTTSGHEHGFKMFLGGRRVPGFGKILGWESGQPRVRRNKFVFGDAFSDRTNIDGEFDEFFLQPLTTSPAHIDAAVRLLRSFTKQHVTNLAHQHHKITCPVHLVWGVHDPFFPIDEARNMMDTFPNARITEIAGARRSPHEERPAEVGAALLPTLLSTTESDAIIPLRHHGLVFHRPEWWGVRSTYR